MDVTLRDALIMGNIYDPDTDAQYVLLRVPAESWDQYMQEVEESEDEEVDEWS